ncbi:MAG: 6-bladed beta-propeller [Balneolaceae bacterium]
MKYSIIISFSILVLSAWVQIERTNTIDDTFTDRLSLEKDEVFGATPDVIVGVIAAFAVDHQNRVFIADRNQTKVHVFNFHGSYLKSLGREGQGPGEFAAVSPTTSMQIQDNLLYITNFANSWNFFPDRAEVFSLGDLSFSHSIDLLAENIEEFSDQLKEYYPIRLYPLEDEKILVKYRRMPSDYKEEKSDIKYVVQDHSGIIQGDEVFTQQDRIQLVYFVRNAEIPYNAISSFPFFKRSLFALSTEGHFVSAQTDEFEIHFYNLNGSLIRSFNHSFEKQSLSRRERIKSYENGRSSLGDGVAADMIREADNLPETWPALNDLLVDDENRLWVSTIVEDFEIYEWWVLEETGEVIAKFEWPRDKPIGEIQNGYAYTLEKEEETGLQSVVRYLIKMD